MRGMENAIEKIRREEEELFSCFPKGGQWPDRVWQPINLVKDVMIDQVSKNLGVLFHQVGPEQLRTW